MGRIKSFREFICENESSWNNKYGNMKMTESNWTIRKTYLPAIDDNLKEDGTFDVTTSDMVGGGREIAETNWNVEVVQDHLSWFEAIATITHTDNQKCSVGDAVEIEIGDNDSIDDIATTIKSEYERTNGR